jgi:quinolinate synthase
MESVLDQIKRLKKEKNAVILAHYYVNDEVQDIADYIGDSYYLSKKATEVSEQVIVFCGVSFMGESAKILNPDKLVLMPDNLANCPMAHMADIDYIENLRKEYDDLAVVCYINSTAELKVHSDVCVTSSNALKIVKALPNKNIFFIPDENLGRYIASLVPEKNFIFNDGFCHVHKSITKENVLKAKKAKPDALVLVHPECTMDVLELADYIGSTSGIIDYATNSDAKEFIICTEMGVLHQLTLKNPDKKFYSVGIRQFCPNMKKVTLEKVRDVLINENNAVAVSDEVRKKAGIPLARMLELAK